MPVIPYRLLLGLHLTAVTVFIAGLLLVMGSLPALAAAAPAWSEEQRRELRWVRRLSRFVVTPALLLVWTFGLWLALRGGWFAMSWLRIKLLFVLLVTVLHGRSARTLRLLEAGTPVPRVGPAPVALALGAVVAIVALVIAKPA